MVRACSLLGLLARSAVPSLRATHPLLHNQVQQRPDLRRMPGESTTGDAERATGGGPFPATGVVCVPPPPPCHPTINLPRPQLVAGYGCNGQTVSDEAVAWCGLGGCQSSSPRLGASRVSCHKRDTTSLPRDKPTSCMLPVPCLLCERGCCAHRYVCRRY